MFLVFHSFPWFSPVFPQFSPVFPAWNINFMVFYIDFLHISGIPWLARKARKRQKGMHQANLVIYLSVIIVVKTIRQSISFKITSNTYMGLSDSNVQNVLPFLAEKVTYKHTSIGNMTKRCTDAPSVTSLIINRQMSWGISKMLKIAKEQQS